MPDDPGPRPAQVTVRGGPSDAAVPQGGTRPALVRTALLAAAALTVVAGVAVGQRQDPPPPDCREPCVPAGSLVLGAALPLTGVLAPSGTAQQRGVQRVLDRVNAEGGLEVAGERRRVELLVRDTRSEPDVAGQEALVLVRGPFGVVGLLGPCAPPVPFVRVAESRDVPLVTGCQPLPDLGGGPLEQTWEVAPGEAQRAAAALEALAGTRTLRTGLFLSNDRSSAPWTTAAQRAGVTVVGTYRPHGRDWAPAVAKAVLDGVQVVVAVTQPPTGIELWRELGRQGLDRQAAYASEAGLGSAWRTAVGRAGDGTITDLVHPADSGVIGPPQVDEALSEVSAELAEVLLDGLRRAQAAERPALQAALQGASAEVAGHDVHFLGDHASRLPVRLARWQDGRLVPRPVQPSG